MVIGLISDTHGLVRAELFDALRGVELILHAGDVGGRAVLDELATIAPVRAVFGNTDAPDDPSLESSIDLQVDGLSIHVSHGHELGSPTPDGLLRRYAADVIVYGHTHKPLVERRGSRLVVNPGAAGPRRFNLHPTAARLTVRSRRATADILPLTPLNPQS
jgi:putative phosphoesterase